MLRTRYDVIVTIVAVLVGVTFTTHVSADRLGASSSRVIKPRRLQARTTDPVVTALRIHPNGKWMVTAGDDHVVRIWDINRGTELRRLSGHTDWVDAATFSPDGNLLATAGKDHRLLLWDLTTGKRTAMVPPGDTAISAIAFSRSGSKLAIVGFDRSIQIYDVEHQTLMRALPAPCRDMRCIEFSPDDRLIAGGGRNGKLAVYDVPSGKQLALLDAHRQRIRAICFDTDNEQVVTAGEDRYLRAWDTKTFELNAELNSDKSKPMSMVSVGPGIIATGGSDNNISIWNLTTMKRQRVLRGHTGSVVALDTKDGLLVSGSFDATVRVWSVDDDDVVARTIRSTR
ncbi:MAG: WD40 repeat domain-containing protein [Planctomycetales bacterium]|nr:WD40 repeat domain-containing protein [Planctomycetales bacterium]